MFSLRGVLVVMLFALLAAMPVRADQTDIGVFASATAQGNVVNTLTVPITVGGNNRYLVLGVSDSASLSRITQVRWVVGVTTQNLALCGNSVAATGTRIEIWDLVAPTVGAGNVIITWSTTAPDTIGDAIATVINFANVNQTTPRGAFAVANGNSNAPSVTVATGDREVVFDCMGADIPSGGTNVNATVGANQIQQWNLRTNGGSAQGNVRGCGSLQAGVLGGAMTWGLSAARLWATGGISVKRVAPALSAVQLVRARVTKRRGRNRLRWRTESEVDNLGYRIYRDGGSGRTLLTPSMIAGSALFVSSRRLPRGRSYVFDDPAPASSSAVYWIEDVDTHGVNTMHGPYGVEGEDEAVGAGTAVEASATLRDLSNIPASRKSPVERGPARRWSPRPRSPLGVQWTLASSGAVKISVETEGWYRVTRDQLVAAGLNPAVNPRRLQLYCDGAEQALVMRGTDDRKFASGDAVEFYATGRDTTWSDRRVYWLTEGSAPGKRVDRIATAGTGTPTASSFPYAVMRHDRSIYVADIHNGDVDNFYGPIVTSQNVDQTLALSNIDRTAAGPAYLTLAMQGFSANPAAAPDHAVAVLVNGQAVGTLSFDGQDACTRAFAVPLSALIDGDNTVTLRGASDDDVTGVTSINVEYPHRYAADSNALLFTATAGQPQRATGFTSNAIRVFDVTDETAVYEITGQIRAEGPTFSVSFRPPGAGSRAFYAVAGSRVAAPAAIELNRPSAWNAASNRGAVVMLTHSALAPALAPLKAARAAQQGSAAVIDVQDLYDEFNFGVKSPAAIRDFLIRAKATWATPPKFVLLAGDASFDPRDYNALGDVDFVPTVIVDTAMLETASDDWYTDTDGDGAADLPIGRLPVRSAAELSVIVSKILAFEQAPADPAWTRKSVFLAERDDSDFSFRLVTSDCAAALPATWRKSMFSIDANGGQACREAMFDAFNSGSALLTYVGHGSVDLWSASNVASGADAASFHGAPRLPVVLSMTCLTGIFHDIYTECLAEAWIKAPAGPVALFASSGFCMPEDQANLARRFLAALGAAPSTTLGQAVVKAKKGLADHDVRVTWQLLGDPAMRLR